MRKPTRARAGDLPDGGTIEHRGSGLEPAAIQTRSSMLI
jgi:hypothetical protein